MAAHSAMSRTSFPPAPQSEARIRLRASRPPISNMGALGRIKSTPQDGATTLALHLAVVRANHRLDVVALVDVQGTLLASAGDRHAAEELAPFAAAAARETRARRAEFLPRLGVIVETVEHGGKTWVLAATATVPSQDVRAIVQSIREILPAIAAVAAARDEEEPDSDFESALDEAFGASWDEDPLAGLASVVG